MNLIRLACTSLAMACLALAGCQPSATAPPEPSASAASGAHDHGDGPHAHADGGHSHGAGPNDGTLADWGGGKYHVEFTVNHDQQETTIYVLGSDEKSPMPVKATDGKLLLSIKEPPFQVELGAAPLDGEPEGAASRYVGKHESLGIVREFAGTISGEVEGTPYAADFEEQPHGDHDHPH